MKENILLLVISIYIFFDIWGAACTILHIALGWNNLWISSLDLTFMHLYFLRVHNCLWSIHIMVVKKWRKSLKNEGSCECSSRIFQPNMYCKGCSSWAVKFGPKLYIQSCIRECATVILFHFNFCSRAECPLFYKYYITLNVSLFHCEI